MRVRECELLYFAVFVWCVAGCTPAPDQEFELTALNEPNATSEDDAGDDGPEIICEPGQTRCIDASTIEVCAPTGLEWETLDCGARETCEACDTVDPRVMCRGVHRTAGDEQRATGGGGGDARAGWRARVRAAVG